MGQQINFGSSASKQGMFGLGEVEDARSLDIQLAVLLHQPASHFPQGVKSLPRGAPALCQSLCDQRQIMHPLSSRRVSIGYLVLA
jgi:hypothetical protein